MLMLTLLGSSKHLGAHRGWKGPFNYFQLCYLMARIKHLDITRYLRSKEVEIVEF